MSSSSGYNQSVAEKLTYTGCGVDYERLDAFKRACQKAALSTRNPSSGFGDGAATPVPDDALLMHCEEGLGTKHLVADAMFELSGTCYYRSIGIDLVAAIVNDLAVTGAMPVSVAMHLSAGSSTWFADEIRAKALIAGFAEACQLVGAVWNGGETATLQDVVSKSSVVLSGSAVGLIRPKSNRIEPLIRERDAIVLVASSGIHANGLTLARAVASRLQRGYLTKMTDGRTFGEALLTPSALYVEFIRQCQIEKVDLHYALQITGHGWRKLMRADEPFIYRIEEVRDPPAEFKLMLDFIAPREAYATFNMGAGLALMLDESDVDRVIEIAQRSGCSAWRAGTVIKIGSEKSVEIVPLGIRYEAESLRLR